MKPVIPARVVHHRFIKAPVITDVLFCQSLRKGQWMKLDWCDQKSRFHSINSRGDVVAFHYPRANEQFAQYCELIRERNQRSA